MSQFRRSFTIYRVAEGSVIDGAWHEGARTQETIQASLQALKPEDFETLEEGRRTTSVFFIFTDTKLDLVTSANPTIVIVNGDEYEVNKEENWHNNVINHYKYMITRILK